MGSAGLAPGGAKQAENAMGTQVFVAYGLFLGIGVVIYHFVADGQFSAIMTMALMLQCLAMLLLLMQFLSTGSRLGISARAVLEAFCLRCHISPTTWLSVYLPPDASSDWICQAIPCCSSSASCTQCWSVGGPPTRSTRTRCRSRRRHLGRS